MTRDDDVELLSVDVFKQLKSSRRRAIDAFLEDYTWDDKFYFWTDRSQIIDLVVSEELWCEWDESSNTIDEDQVCWYYGVRLRIEPVGPSIDTISTTQTDGKPIIFLSSTDANLETDFVYLVYHSF